VVGFDVESKPVFVKGTINKVALVQVTDEENTRWGSGRAGVH